PGDSEGVPVNHQKRIKGRQLSRRALRSIPFSAVLLLATAVIVFSQAWVVAKVSFYLGEVGYKKSQSEEWTGLALQQSLFSGDTVKTGAESRLELKAGDEGFVIRIDENSEIELTPQSLENPGTKAKARGGRVWSNVRSMAANRNNLTIETPTVLAAVRGTVFRIDVPDLNSTVLRVYEGEVEVKPNLAPPPGEGGMREVVAPREIAPPSEVSAQQWMEIVSANQQLSFTRGEKPVITDFDPEADAQLDWVQWNRERDEGLDRTAVPPPVERNMKQKDRRKNSRKD
ncbi:FecR domain-containing protein, partial [Gemmatimonadota bacterium]